MTKQDAKKEEARRLKEAQDAKVDAKFRAVLNPAGFVDMKKSEFKEEYKGKLPFDLDQAWDWIQKNKPKKSKA